MPPSPIRPCRIPRLAAPKRKNQHPQAFWSPRARRLSRTKTPRLILNARRIEPRPHPQLAAPNRSTGRRLRLPGPTWPKEPSHPICLCSMRPSCPKAMTAFCIRQDLLLPRFISSNHIIPDVEWSSKHSPNLLMIDLARSLHCPGISSPAPDLMILSILRPSDRSTARSKTEKAPLPKEELEH